jgi:hypothetical protein
MREYHPTGELKGLLTRFAEASGAIRFVMLDNDLDLDEESLHRLASWFAGLLERSRGTESRENSSEVNEATVETVSRFVQEYHEAFETAFPLTPMERFTLFRQLNLLLFGEFAHWSIRRWETPGRSQSGFEHARVWTLIHEERRHGVWMFAEW